jgi:hypothetical protein
MRKVLIFFGMFALLSAAVSAEIELDTDLMQSIEDSNKSLSSNIALKAGKAATSDAKELAAMFTKVEAFYAQKTGVDDAVELTKKSMTLTAAIIASVASNNFDAASESSTALSRTCKSCHTFYKKD